MRGGITLSISQPISSCTGELPGQFLFRRPSLFVWPTVGLPFPERDRLAITSFANRRDMVESKVFKSRCDRMVWAVHT